MPPLQRLLGVVAVASALGGCTLVLGDFNSSPDAADMGDGASTGAGDDGGTSDSPLPDSTSSADGGGVDGTISDGRAGGDTSAGDSRSGDATTNDAADGSTTDDAGSGPCSPQATRCSGNGVQTCDSNGVWGAAAACPSATPFCNGAGVCGVCSDTTTQCSDAGGVQTCTGGSWQMPVPCMGQTCSMGACAGTCTPGTTQCSGTGSVQKCDMTGHWGMATPCTGQTCVGGMCQGACSPGQTTCSAGGIQTCDAMGNWGTATPCGANQSCTGGAMTGNPATCTCNVDATCKSAGLACANGSTVVNCTQDAQGCWYASSTSMCANGACFGSAGSAGCCTNGCTANATQCGGAGLQTCQVQANGCTGWNAGAACGTHQTCTGPAGTAACTCNTDALCTATGNVCSGTSIVRCAQDAQNCFYQAGTQSCGTNQMCSSGMCVCNSGFTSCGTSCVDVLTDNNNCGTCGHVCPVLTAPSYGAICGAFSAGSCGGYVGGYVQVSGATPLPTNSDAMSIYAVQATMPAGISGTFMGVGGTFGSNNPAGDTTQMILGLYSDSGGAPGLLYFYTNDPDTTMQYPDPATTLVRLQSASGQYMNNFNDALAAGTSYWVYMKAGTDGTTANTAGVSTSPCKGAQWINVDPPGTFTAQGSRTCPGDFNLYMLVGF